MLQKYKAAWKYHNKTNLVNLMNRKEFLEHLQHNFQELYPLLETY